MLEKSPDDRPSIAEVWSYIEKLKSKTSNKSKPKHSELFNSESKDDSDELASKYASAQQVSQAIDKLDNSDDFDEPDKNFTGFSTKLAASIAKKMEQKDG